MSERDIRANFLIIRDSLKSKTPSKDHVVVDAALNVLEQFCVDIHEIAEAARLNANFPRGLR